MPSFPHCSCPPWGLPPTGWSGRSSTTETPPSLRAEKIRISWPGRERCYDNILVERLWRTVKYEEVYLRAYSDDWEAEISLARFQWRYCHVRPHSSLGGRTPYKVYTENGSCPSRLGLTMSGAISVQ
ncbi:MAG: transposase [Synechococcus sp.]